MVASLLEEERWLVFVGPYDQSPLVAADHHEGGGDRHRRARPSRRESPEAPACSTEAREHADFGRSKGCRGRQEIVVAIEDDASLTGVGNTHTDDSFVGWKTTRMAQKATEYIKQCMGTDDDDTLIFCGSGTSTTTEVVEIGIDEHVLLDVKALRRQLVALKHANMPILGSLLYIEDYIVREVLPLLAINSFKFLVSVGMVLIHVHILAGNTHTDDSFVGWKTTQMAHKAAEYIKQCMGTDDDDMLIFCGSGTSVAIKQL
ncbi:hypothetical protein Cni_G19483 [Canna indica]|uniref:Uncharacterized protein n=1 Tax=Canna indica TaxID=4628 RepID=A0AAQ3QGZ4_9LILI|nr:hypothetical protein Cni_G19483 [Canna indica]